MTEPVTRVLIADDEPPARIVLREMLERLPGVRIVGEAGDGLEAVAGEAPIAVTGEDGREALAVALTIVQDIERTFPSLSGAIPAHSGA